MAPHSSTLAWKIPWTEEPGGLQSMTRILPQLEKKHVGPSSALDEALARDGVSREVPCSALKGETVPDSLPAQICISQSHLLYFLSNSL